MGKGGYHGGSTIVTLRPSNKETFYDVDPNENKQFTCEVCLSIFSGSQYFNHLSVKHGLHGCLSCGKSYKTSGERIHICVKCGKKIILRIGKKSEKDNIPAKRKQQQNLKKLKTIKQINNIDRARILNPKIDDDRKKKNKTFGTSLADLLEEALRKKLS